MLTEVRHKQILDILKKQKVVTVEALTKTLNSSESTIRRDLNALAKQGKLNKVHGGATYKDKHSTKEEYLSVRQQENVDEKRAIGKYAATLLEENDFVYLDAGTSTAYFIESLTQANVTFVTNGIAQAKKLMQLGYRVFLLGGELKPVTEALIGEGAIHSIRNYNFTKGFFGTNGVSLQAGFTTLEVEEAAIKKEAIAHCAKAFVLADHSKIEKVLPITFASLEAVTLITNAKVTEEMKKKAEIIEVKKR